MTVIRIKKTENFVTLYKGCLQNLDLSFKAKGLWAYCMSMPDNWTFKVSHLATVSKEGEDAVYSAIKELEIAGYVKKIQTTKNGRFQPVDYEINEFPINFQKNLPLRDFPDAVFPDAENPALLNNDSNKKEIYKSPPINPPRRGDTEAKPPVFSEPLKRKKLKEEHKLREERIYTTETQHKKLLSMASGNEALVQEWYKRLSIWKIGSGIDGGRFDFNSINKWVISAVEKEKNTSQNNSFSSKSTSTLNDAQQRNFDENKQIVEEIKLAMPEKPISIWYKDHVLKGPGFDISMLVDPRDLIRYLSKKLHTQINYEESDEKDYD